MVDHGNRRKFPIWLITPFWRIGIVREDLTALGNTALLKERLNRWVKSDARTDL